MPTYDPTDVRPARPVDADPDPTLRTYPGPAPSPAALEALSDQLLDAVTAIGDGWTPGHTAVMLTHVEALVAVVRSQCDRLEAEAGR